MQVQISGQKIEVTDALRNHVQSKIDRLFRHYDNLTSLTVVLSVEKLVHAAEGTLAGGAGFSAHAKGTGPDMYASIDLMFEKLVTQTRKHKEKLTNKGARDARAAARAE